MPVVEGEATALIGIKKALKAVELCRGHGVPSERMPAPFPGMLGPALGVAALEVGTHLLFEGVAARAQLRLACLGYGELWKRHGLTPHVPAQPADVPLGRGPPERYDPP